MKTLVLAFLAMLTLVPPPLAQATDLPRIMIVGEDVDPDAVPRKSRVHKRVLDAIANQLIDQGFDVRDEAALTHNTHAQGKSRRSDAELIQIAKDVGVDVLAIFSIYPTKHTTSSTIRVKARVTGRLLSVYDGMRLGNFESEPQQYQVVQEPHRPEDVLEAIGSMAKIIASDVGAVLADRLDQYHPTQPSDTVASEGATHRPQRIIEWIIILDGFSDEDAMAAEDRFTTFPGYDRHRTKPNATNTPTHHEYLYMSSLDSSDFKRRLLDMVAQLNIKARLYMSGNEVEIVKISKVKQRTKS